VALYRHIQVICFVFSTAIWLLLIWYFGIMAKQGSHYLGKRIKLKSQNYNYVPVAVSQSIRVSQAA